MHAANESAGVHDLAHMIRAMRAFHETEVVILGDGRIRLMGLE
jgi:hypothetical protein